MPTVDLLQKIRDGEAVAPAALHSFAAALGQGQVPDYQVGAFLMAVRLRGLSPALTAALTWALRDSGSCFDLTAVPGIKVDKHSTGGVGDKISLALAPLVAACGVPVPMVSGRGLGHTGGTLDKLEAIPGFRAHRTDAEFVAQMLRLGVCMSGQTATLAPADGRLYAIRDLTATVDSVPLITASILAKKLAEGCQGLVLDIKVGSGAFMRSLAQARELAQSLVRVGQLAGLQVVALLTRMDHPLGTHIGNALEVRESIAILRGQGPADTTELTLILAAEMLVLGGVVDGPVAARQRLQRAIASGAALAKMRDLLDAQGGDSAVLDRPELLPQAPHVTPLMAELDGHLQALDALPLGRVSMALGAGRRRAEDPVDPAVGLVLHQQVGARVRAGEPLLSVHHRAPVPPALWAQLQSAVHIGPPLPPQPLLLERHVWSLDGDGALA